MDHLFNDFKQKGINAFRDDNKLPKGEEISPHLYKAIEESRILIVIFSKNYASSSWCLRELGKIIECKQIENPKHEVRIIFYDVKPDVVRKQKGSYAEAFRNHEVSNSAHVSKWKEALSMAADLSGFDLQDMTDGYESKFIDCISKEILKKLCDGPLHVGENLVGIDFHFDKLDLSRFVGCFCEDYKEVTKRQPRLKSDTEQEVGKIMTMEDLKIIKCCEGICNKEDIHQNRSFCFDDWMIMSRLRKPSGSSDGFPATRINLFSTVISYPLRQKILLEGSRIAENMSLLQAMARGIVSEESSMPGNRSRLWVNPSEIYNILSEKKATQVVEILDIVQMKTSQKFDIDGKAFARMKNLRILKLPIDHGVNFSGRLDCLSNKLRLLYWHGCPFKLLPSDFCPENIVVIDLSYSNIKQLWTTPKCLRRLKIMKLRHCCNLTTTPDFSEITNLEELDLEGCVNMVTVHPSIGMLKRLVVLNMRDCRRARSCLNVNQRSRWWTSIPSFIWNQQHPQRSVSLSGLHMLKSLNFSRCNLEQVPESIGSLSCLERLDLKENNFTCLPGSLSQLSHLLDLFVDGCKKLEVLPELPHSLENLYSSFCNSLREVSGSSKDRFRYRYNNFIACPKLFKNVSIDSEGSISKTQCLDSSITSQGFVHQLSATLGYLGFETTRCEFFLQDIGSSDLDIVYHGDSIPEWFTVRSTENHVKVELPSDWCHDKFRGFGTCVLFKCKKPHKFKRYSIKNFDGASLVIGDYFPYFSEEFMKNEVIGIHESYMILLHYTKSTWRWKEAKNFVTFSFQENNEDVEMKECGVRLICDGDLQLDITNLSMFQDLSTLSQHGGAMSLYGPFGYCMWSCCYLI
ncbi:NB-ARC domains-containing protein [Tanacetum coccineum]